MTIKHLVISGGGSNGYISLGIIHRAFQKKLISYDTIETTHGTSAGAITVAAFALKIDIDQLIDYLIKYNYRKITDCFAISSDTLTNIYTHHGILGEEHIETVFASLLKTVDLSPKITLKELYEYSGITTNIYTTQLNPTKSVCLNHITFPNISLIKAIHMSSCIPVLYRLYIIFLVLRFIC